MTRGLLMPGILNRTSAVLGLLILMVASATAQEDSVLVSPTGQRVQLSSFRGKVVVLLFSGVQDPQCRDEFKTLQSLSDRYQNKNVSIFWVSVNPESVASNDKLKSPCGPPGNVPVVRDPDESAYRRFATGVRQLPTIVVLDREGRVGGKPRGGFSPDSDFVNDLASLVDELLARK